MCSPGRGRGGRGDGSVDAGVLHRPRPQDAGAQLSPGRERPGRSVGARGRRRRALSSYLYPVRGGWYGAHARVEGRDAAAAAGLARGRARGQARGRVVGGRWHIPCSERARLQREPGRHGLRRRGRRHAPTQIRQRAAVDRAPRGRRRRPGAVAAAERRRRGGAGRRDCGD